VWELVLLVPKPAGDGVGDHHHHCSGGQEGSHLGVRGMLNMMQSCGMWLVKSQFVWMNS